MVWGIIYLIFNPNENKIYFESVDENKKSSSDNRDFTFFAYLVVVVLVALTILISFN